MRFGAAWAEPPSLALGRGVALTYTLTDLIAGHLPHLEISCHPDPSVTPSLPPRPPLFFSHIRFQSSRALITSNQSMLTH